MCDESSLAIFVCHFGRCADDAHGQISSVTDPLDASIDRLGRTRDFHYDAASRNTGETWLASDGVTVDDRITFTYDDAGNQLTAQNQWGTQTLTYDALNRVVRPVRKLVADEKWRNSPVQSSVGRWRCRVQKSESADAAG